MIFINNLIVLKMILFESFSVYSCIHLYISYLFDPSLMPVLV